MFESFLRLLILLYSYVINNFLIFMININCIVIISAEYSDIISSTSNKIILKFNSNRQNLEYWHEMLPNIGIFMFYKMFAQYFCNFLLYLCKENFAISLLIFMPFRHFIEYISNVK